MGTFLWVMFWVMCCCLMMSFFATARACRRKEQALSELLALLEDIEVLDGRTSVFLPCDCGAALLGDGVVVLDHGFLHGVGVCQPTREALP